MTRGVTYQKIEWRHNTHEDTLWLDTSCHFIHDITWHIYGMLLKISKFMKNIKFTIKWRKIFKKFPREIIIYFIFIFRYKIIWKNNHMALYDQCDVS
jgi:hypothetical protein